MKWYKGERINVVVVGYHEWAKSRRTEGAPVYSVAVHGGTVRVREVGRTRKIPTSYYVAPGSDLLREYRTNSGRVVLHYYPEGGDEITVEEEKLPFLGNLPPALAAVAWAFLTGKWAGEGEYPLAPKEE